MRARLKPQPLSQWVELGRRMIIAAHAREGWRVIADATNRKGVKVKQQGLSLFPEPAVLSGKHSSVIYEELEANEAARQILSDADDVVPALDKAYARDLAARHPVIFLVRDEKQGEQLSGVKSFRAEVPDGFVLDGVSYIEWPGWSAGGPVERDGTIAHELTHVASWTMLGRRRTAWPRGWRCTTSSCSSTRSGTRCRCCTSSRCTRAGGSRASRSGGGAPATGGIKNPQAVEACYEDAQMMVTVILQRHGGPAGLERLANAFTAMHIKRVRVQRGAGAGGVPARAGRVVRPGGRGGARLRSVGAITSPRRG